MLREMIRDGRIGPVCWAGREILQRIFVSVRDRNWREIAPTQWRTYFDDARDRVTIEARHTSDLVDFQWSGVLQLDSDRHGLTFEFSGEALRDMQVCRLGLIVLHPVAAMVGATLVARGPSQEERFQIGSPIHPQPIIEGLPQAMAEPFEALEISRPDLGVLRLAFAGDLFELEDQRNWGDASFKAYCTPLRLGFPRQVDRGTRIAHGMRATYTPAEAATSVAVAAATPRDTKAATFPLLGRTGCDGPHNAARQGLDCWHHVQIDVGTLREALMAASLPKTIPLELCVDAIDRGTQESIEELRQRGAKLVRVLVQGVGTQPPSADSVAAVREWLADCTLPVLSATAGYFVEHNRDVPLEGAVQGIAFALTATVHSEDAATIRANVATIADMARTARALRPAQAIAIAIAPLALNFPARPRPVFPQAMAAPWLAATLMHAGLAGVTSATVAADVLAAIESSPLLEALCRFGGCEIKPPDLPLQNHVHALELAGPAGARHLLVANLRETPATLPAFLTVRGMQDLQTGAAVPVDRGANRSIAPGAVMSLAIG